MTQNYTLKQLIDKILSEITESIKSDPSLAAISKSDTEEDVYSMLRDRIFRTDAKTKKFLDGIKALFAAPTAAIAAKALSEADFSQILYESLDKFLAKKDSNLKLAHYYFSPEQDLVVSLADNNGNRSDFRILVIKTS